jgi:hypothetical protein
MRLVNFKNYDVSKLDKLVQLHLGKTKLKNGYVFLDDKSKIIGYTILIPSKNTIKIDWIYSKKGFGTKFLKRLEKILFKKYNKIILNVSIDPNEKKETVLRRINFYIKNNYRVSDIKFRKKHGPLLLMYKK